MLKRSVLLALLLNSSLSHALDFSPILVKMEQEDPLILNAKSSYLAAVQREQHIKKTINPTVVVSLSVLNNKMGLKGVGSPEPIQSFGSRSAGIAFVQSIYNPIKEVDISSAELQVEYESLQLLQARNDAAVRILEAVIDIALANTQVSICKMEVELINEFLKSSNTKALDAGDRAGYEIRLNNAKGQLENILLTFEQKKGELVSIGGGVVSPDALVIDESYYLFDDSNSGALRDLLERAEQENIQLRSQRVVSGLADLVVKRNSREKYPTAELVFNGAYVRGMPAFRDGRNFNTAVGLQISVPIVDSGFGASMQADALFQQSKANNDYQANRVAVQKSIIESYYELRRLSQQIHMQHKNLDIFVEQKNRVLTALAQDDEHFRRVRNLEIELSILSARQELLRLRRDGLIQWVRLKSLVSSFDKHEYGLVQEKVKSILRK